jgi:hypothetical protein
MTIRSVIRVLVVILALSAAMISQTASPHPVTVGGIGNIAAQGNGSKVQLSTGSTTTNDCVKFDANANTVDAGVACGSRSAMTSVTGTP